MNAETRISTFLIESCAQPRTGGGGLCLSPSPRLTGVLGRIQKFQKGGQESENIGIESAGKECFGSKKMYFSAL